VLLAACAPAPAPAAHTTIGPVGLDLDVASAVREVFEVDRSVTHERTLLLARTHATLAFTNWLRFDSTTVVTNGGPTMLATSGGVYNWNDVFQELSPGVDFEEAYVDLLLPSLDLRLGKQRVAWGKLDRTQPNDLINPRSYLDPFLEGESEQKLGVPAVQASYFPPAAWRLPDESRLTVVWVPRYLPYRFPRASCDVVGDTSPCSVERWFPPAVVPPSTFTTPLPAGAGPPALTVPLSFQVHNSSPPAWRMDNSEIAVRYSALLRESEFATYYFHGFDLQPAFQLEAEALGEPDPSPGNPIGVANLHGATTVSPAFNQINAWGADFAFAADRFTVRAEGAYVHGRPFSPDLRTLVTNPASIVAQIPSILGALAAGAGQVPVALPPSVVVRDAVEWGIGADWTYNGYVALLQLNQTDVLNNDTELLIKNTEARVLGTLRKDFLSETLEVQLISLYGISSDYTMLRPRVRYRFGNALTAELGYLFIAGRSNSLVGEFKHNDEGWLRIEYRI
jgi:hypothetical protein